MAGASKENGFERLDRRIGMAWSRICGVLLLIPAGWMLVGVLRADDFSVAGYWPMLAGIAVFGFLAFRCFRSRESMLSILSDVGTNRDNSRN